MHWGQHGVQHNTIQHRTQNTTCYTIKLLMWSDEDIQLLGVSITNGPIQTSDNFDLCFSKMEVTIDTSYNSLWAKFLLLKLWCHCCSTTKMSLLLSMNERRYRGTIHWLEILVESKRSKILLVILFSHKRAQWFVFDKHCKQTTVTTVPMDPTFIVDNDLCYVLETLFTWNLKWDQNSVPVVNSDC